MASVYERDFSAGLSGKYSLVFERVKAGTKVLELGCSTGYFSRVLSQKGCTVTGIDSDSNAVTACKQKGLDAHYHDLNANSISEMVSAQQPDCVIAMDVLEHLVRPDRLLSMLAGSIGDNTTLIVTGPNVAYWHVRWQLLRGRWEYVPAGIMDSTHLRWFTRSSWRKLLSDNGFQIIEDVIAESMIPKESILRSVIGNRQVEITKRFAERWLPESVAIVFLFHCVKQRVRA